MVNEGADGRDQIVRAFWHDLDQLRRQQGLSYQRLAKLTAIPHSTLQHWMTRRRGLPSWIEVRPVVVALDASEREWFHQWKRAVGDLHGEAETLHNLGEMHQTRAAMDTALSCYRQALDIWRNIGDQWAKAATLDRIASLSS